MHRRVEGIIEQITAERQGAQELLVRVIVPEDPVPAGLDPTLPRPALNLLALNPRVEVGERVLLNTTAVQMGLGTGGFDFVICRTDRPEFVETPPGHIMKLRYTPLQFPVLAVEAQESRHHEAIRRFETLEECPVVCAELHSQVPAICSAARWGLRDCGWTREPRIVYVMTDGAALPLALSRLVPEMRAGDLIQATVTSGQAFGGDYEAVNLYSALAAARAVCAADIIVVAQGPGNVGTGTPLGFSGVEQGLAINAAGALGGIPILVPRLSFADARHRHQTVSHHTLTVLQRVALVPALIAIPKLPREQLNSVRKMLDDVESENIHQTVVVAAERAFEDYRRHWMHVTTMGRTVEQEHAFFLAATAAGLLAAQVVEAGIN